MVGARGFEPPTPWSRTRCATRLRYAPNFDADAGFRVGSVSLGRAQDRNTDIRSLAEIARLLRVFVAICRAMKLAALA